jgi:hypothetical protein
MRNITTPIGGQEVEIKEWITGREAEYIDELTYEAVAVKANVTGGADIEKVDLKKIITEANHRKIEKFVVSIDGVKDDLLNKVLDMNEQDTAFIVDAIEDQRKKK